MESNSGIAKTLELPSGNININISVTDETKWKKPQKSGLFYSFYKDDFQTPLSAIKLPYHVLFNRKPVDYKSLLIFNTIINPNNNFQQERNSLEKTKQETLFNQSYAVIDAYLTALKEKNSKVTLCYFADETSLYIAELNLGEQKLRIIKF
jgi:hypothetical protein